MGSMVVLDEAMMAATDELARVIASGFVRLETRNPHLPDPATQQH
jgi:hypothetical protein